MWLRILVYWLIGRLIDWLIYVSAQRVSMWQRILVYWLIDLFIFDLGFSTWSSNVTVEFSLLIDWLIDGLMDLLIIILGFRTTISNVAEDFSLFIYLNYWLIGWLIDGLIYYCFRFQYNEFQYGVRYYFIDWLIDWGWILF